MKSFRRRSSSLKCTFQSILLCLWATLAVVSLRYIFFKREQHLNCTWAHLVLGVGHCAFYVERPTFLAFCEPSLGLHFLGPISKNPSLGKSIRFYVHNGIVEFCASFCPRSIALWFVIRWKWHYFPLHIRKLCQMSGLLLCDDSREKRQLLNSS